MSIQKKNTPPVLKTPQSLIHIKHNMSILQYKYWVVLLHHIKDQLEQGVEPDKHGYHYISFNEINDFLGYTPKKSEVYRDLKQLRSYAVEYNVLEKDGEKAKVVEGFLRAASVSSKRVGYVLPPVFIEAILGIDGSRDIFQLLNWEIFNSFSGKYEAIIYKLCKDYVGVGRTPYMTIEEYREYIGLKENEYPLTDNLNRRCIKNPIKNINKSELSDIKVEVIFHRTGRRLSGLHFEITEKKQQTIKFPDFEPHPAFMFSKVNIPVDKQNQYLKDFQESEIQAIIRRANDYADDVKSKGKKLNLDGVYKKAFSEGWGVENLHAEEKDQEQKKKKLEAEKKDQEQKKKLEAEEKKREEAENEAIIGEFFRLPKEEQERRILAVIKDTDSFFSSIYKKSYDKYGTEILTKDLMFLSAYEKWKKVHF